MTQKERLSTAIDIFSKNKYWKDYYENAPSELCKEHIACEFSCSKYNNPADFEYEKNIEPELKKADWDYLLRFAGNNQYAAAIKAKMKDYGIE